MQTHEAKSKKHFVNTDMDGVSTILVDVDTALAFQAASAAEAGHPVPEADDDVHEDDDDFVQTIYQCSLCQRMFQSYHELQIHCEEHTKEEQETDVETLVENAAAEGGEVLLEVKDSDGMVMDGATISQNGQQYVVVYDVPTGGNEWNI